MFVRLENLPKILKGQKEKMFFCLSVSGITKCMFYKSFSQQNIGRWIGRYLLNPNILYMMKMTRKHRYTRKEVHVK